MIVYNSHLQLSENFEISKILFQTCHFRRQRFGQEFGINFFGDIRTYMESPLFSAKTANECRATCIERVNGSPICSPTTASD